LDTSDLALLRGFLLEAIILAAESLFLAIILATESLFLAIIQAK